MKCPNYETHVVLLSKDYDTHYCVDCNVWLERHCGDVNCFFCSGRPERPFTENKL